MMRSSLIRASIALLMFGIAPFAYASSNPQRGLEISAVCQSCHGIDGNLSLQDDYPKLGGQHADYLAQALRAYRSGDRNHAIMSGFARHLSDQDIADLAAWYSRQSGLINLKLD